MLSLTKSAQVPFRGWLPKAISAPTPTSALVHSSTLVTAGLVLIINYSEFVSRKTVLSLLMSLGLVTMLAGRLRALGERRVKKLVAYSTLSQVGLGVIVFGLGEFQVSYCNLIAHGLAKRLLFMQVGVLIHGATNQQAFGKWSFISQNHGLVRVQLLVSLLSLSGLTFYRGMVGKECILELINANRWYALLLLCMIIRVYLTLVYRSFIYVSLHFSCRQPVVTHQSRLAELGVTLAEGVLTVAYFR